ncbi:uncharacterized protein LOC112694091 [Sipha flava]|uniref:Uncharacterized protein LOC112694091 n=1 Tax=Sipha flava TaxID=143950 RepID=A0A8B8GSK4_9HEMI|nr:uncharacterized protein LOC112694091 [Sipha flava]
MAGCIDDLSKSMGALFTSDDDHLKELGLTDAKRAKLREIENYYESVFSWDVKKLTNFKSSLLIDHIDHIQEKYEMHIACYKKDAFDLKRFCLQLIISYELYNRKNYEKSLLEIESMFLYLKSCKFDDSNKQYSEAYKHIAWSTYTYISLTLNRDSEKILKNVKPVNGLNQTEKAAICGLKALIFMEYPPKGNDIGLKLAEEARILDSSEIEWIKIWLKAKGRVRRFYDMLKIPDEDEIHAADILCTKTNPRDLIEASDLYINVASSYKQDKEKARKYFKISSDVILKAIRFSENNVHELCSCLMASNRCPIMFQSKEVKNIVEKLTNIKNGQFDLALGQYFFKQEKDYEKAKMYFSRGMAVGNFDCSLNLIKTQCIESSIDEFPFVNQLKMIYDVFPSPKRRLIILLQILYFYFYHEDNPRELMHYLKLYMDQEIEDKIKKQQIIKGSPFFKKPKCYVKYNEFLSNLLKEVKHLIKHPQWTEEEKCIINDTYVRCYKMSRVNLNENEFVDDGQMFLNKKNEDRYNKNPLKNSNNDSWRKKRNVHKNYDGQ